MKKNSESSAWKVFKEAATFVSFLFGFAWLFFSSMLMLATVLRAIVH